jgi:protein gp37
MAHSRIEWTESTWNPVTGCTKISQGCKHCYAERMAKRLKAMGNPNYGNGFEVTLQPHMLERPLEWKKPQRIFVNSMSDLFHEDVPTDYTVALEKSCAELTGISFRFSPSATGDCANCCCDTVCLAFGRSARALLAQPPT